MWALCIGISFMQKNNMSYSGLYISWLAKNIMVMVVAIINVAFGRHQCERQLPNFTKFATIMCLPLPVIFPTWTKRLFDFQWRSHPDLLCSPVAVLCTNYNLENDCSRQFVKCKLGCQTENDSHYRWSVLRIVECIFCLREVYFREWWCWIVTFLWQLVLMAVNL